VNERWFDGETLFEEAERSHSDHTFSVSSVAYDGILDSLAVAAPELYDEIGRIQNRREGPRD
jgi:hypothetical protein